MPLNEVALVKMAKFFWYNRETETLYRQSQRRNRLRLLGAHAPLQSVGQPHSVGVFGPSWDIRNLVGNQEQHLPRSQLGEARSTVVRTADLGFAHPVLDSTVSHL